jgi:deazaflavin-dependent oxidoreductase (nitroreductase family)
MSSAAEPSNREARNMSSTSPVAVPPRGSYGVKMPRLPGWLMRLGNDLMFSYFRNRPFRGGKVLSLHTVGAKSGQARRNTVAYLQESPSSWLVIASGGGTATHPAWLHNLAAHPDHVEVEIGSKTLAVRAQTLTGEERAAAWNRITSVMPVFKGYETKTDREIPVVRLTAV